jgi:osmotically-inducible protein OsmY
VEVSETTRSIASPDPPGWASVGAPVAALITVSVTLLIVALAIGCSAGARPVDERVADAVLASTVRQRLADDHDLSTTIDVAVSNGIVTLTGRVPGERLRQRAEELARGAEGAREVRNLIRVYGPGE